MSKVDTKKVTGRRAVHYSTLADIQKDVDKLASGAAPRVIGNWSAGEIVNHLAKAIGFSVDGHPVGPAALPLRIFGRVMRNRVMRKPTPSGIKLPEKYTYMLPEPGVSLEEAVGRLRPSIGRAQKQHMTKPSPIFGSLNHEQWEQFHCRHAELHLSFLTM